MPHDPVRIAETKSWLVKAARDLRAADHEWSATPPLRDDIAFHCQQAVEKSLKAFLTWHDVAFRKTHDLIELGQACVGVQADVSSLLRRAAPLTEYAWKFRYPGDIDEPSPGETHEAFSLAREIYEKVLELLPQESRP
jgi:HEPN domain-containing protein